MLGGTEVVATPNACYQSRGTSGANLCAMRVPRAGPLDSAKRNAPVPATSREGARTQRAGTGSDDGRHSRLISP